MEYQGIITGIGDKENNINLIKPELDALINKFIIGKSTIIQGLELKDNILSKGTCILCGYRGIIEEDITLGDNDNYIYAEFDIKFNEDEEDTFNIQTQRYPIYNAPIVEEITQAGTYRILLYEQGALNPNIDLEHPYPAKAQYSVETKKVLGGAVIEDDVTTETAEVNAHESQPNRVVNTEYVHAQIEREVDYDEIVIDLKCKDIRDNEGIAGTITFYKKSRYVIGIIETTTPTTIYTLSSVWFDFPKKFIPNQNGQIIVGQGDRYGQLYRFTFAASITRCDGTIENTYYLDGNNMATTVIDMTNYRTVTFGYQCQ